MKITTLILALAVLSVATLPQLPLGAQLASAQSSSYSIENIDHQIEVIYSGNVVIRDTVTVKGQIRDGFLIGFPYKYSSYILKGLAFSSKEVLPLSLDVQLGERSGFYGAKVTFPSESPQKFTVIFILSNELLTSHSGGFYLDFPAYPSLAQEAARCNVTIVLPKGASVVDVTKDDGTVRSGKFAKDNLPAFACFPANADLEVSGGCIKQVGVTALNRVITLGIAGEITASDSYRIRNNSTEQLTSIKIDVPINASNILARDEIGASLSTATLLRDESVSITSLNVTLNGPLRSGQSTTLRVEYTLPSASIEETRFTLNLELFPYFSYYIHEVSISIIPPEGARIVLPTLSSVTSSLTLDREVFQETLRFDREGLSYVDHDLQVDKTMRVAYEYNSIWVSFRPALWVWGLTGVGSAVLIFVRRPKAPKPSKPPRIPIPKLTGSKIGSEQVKSLVDAYEEKSRLSSEMKLLSLRVQKGKVPRRQYKVQSRALGLRISSLSKTIAELKPTFVAAGGHYADLVQQLTNAENEVNLAEASLRVAEARNKTGELSLEDYKQAISEIQQRKEKAESKISGILLRLREEIR